MGDIHPSLIGTYDRLGYERVELPHGSVAARADLILDTLAGGAPGQ